MFGYIMVNQPELKIKDYRIYHSYYCGLCRILQSRFGLRGQMSLTYDMTFLILLLTGLYEPECKIDEQFCILHPTKKHLTCINKYTLYAADMNLLSSYYQMQDNWNDDKNPASIAQLTLYQNLYKKIKHKYPDKIARMEAALTQLQKYEYNKESNIDLVAGCSGRMIAEIFTPHQDVWQDDLYKMGFYIGKFIYLMDAYEDLEKDLAKGLYNPLTFIKDQPDFEDQCQMYLTLMMSDCTRYFEKLPIIKDIEILRNILYSGVWSKYQAIRHKDELTDTQRKKLKI